jgi:hypothetical protein
MGRECDAVENGEGGGGGGGGRREREAGRGRQQQLSNRDQVAHVR